MGRLRIHIKEIINTPNAITQKLGNQLFEYVSPFLEKDVPIILDFVGISSVTSGFCNASIGRLYSTFPDIADSKISIENIDKSSVWYEKIMDSIELAKNPEKAKIIDAAIAALFE